MYLINNMLTGKAMLKDNKENWYNQNRYGANGFDSSIICNCQYTRSAI